jgi:Icc protein
MNQAYNLIQISDCHIDDQVESMGVDTHANLASVVKAVTKHNCDTLLITGDLAHNGTLNSYQVLQRMLMPIKSRIVVLSGNHDQIENLNQVFSEQLISKFSLGNWEIITIDSTQTLDNSGYVTKKALDQLAQDLQNSVAKYNIVALHHPIVSMQSDWDDSLSLENADELFNVMNKYPKIKAVLWGHAHQASEFDNNDVVLISCPSTALQYDNETRIGFNHYRLHDDGKLEYNTQWI